MSCGIGGPTRSARAGRPYPARPHPGPAQSRQAFQVPGPALSGARLSPYPALLERRQRGRVGPAGAESGPRPVGSAECSGPSCLANRRLPERMAPGGGENRAGDAGPTRPAPARGRGAWGGGGGGGGGGRPPPPGGGGGDGLLPFAWRWRQWDCGGGGGGTGGERPSGGRMQGRQAAHLHFTFTIYTGSTLTVNRLFTAGEGRTRRSCRPVHCTCHAEDVSRLELIRN
jgi:translation initiation factor IF-2